eukprot:EG_transcript_22765
MRLSVKFGKETIELDLPGTATVGQLKEELSGRTGVQPTMQKLMLKTQLKEDDKSLEALGIKEGTKMMLMGTTVEQALNMALVPVITEEVKPAETASTEAEAEKRRHEKVIKLGPPKDATPGVVGQQVPVIPDQSYTGMLNARGERVRLTLKSGTNELWISSNVGCQKLPFDQVTDVTVTPIEEHPGYCIFSLHVGKNHKVHLYFVPMQFSRSLKTHIVGYDPMAVW